MSNDQGSQIKKTMFILKSNPMALQNAESFLRTRGWEISSSTNLQEALPVILSKNPEYLLLCANHHQRKVKQLPKVLAQAISIKILVYVDSATALNMSLMQGFGIPHQLLPPVSGPAIERAIFKLEKEELHKYDDKKKYSEAEKQNAFAIPTRKSNEDFQSAINQFINTANDDSDESSHSSSSYNDSHDKGGQGIVISKANSGSGGTGPAIIQQSGQQKSSVAYRPDATPSSHENESSGFALSQNKENQKNTSGHFALSNDDKNASMSGYAMSNSDDPSNLSQEGGFALSNDNVKGPGPDALGRFNTDSNNNSNSDNSFALSQNQTTNEHNTPSEEPPPFDQKYESFTEYEERMKKEGQGKIQTGKKPHMNLEESKRTHFQIHNKGTQTGYRSSGLSTDAQSKKGQQLDSIMVKGAQHALDSASVKSNTQSVEKISNSQNCLCIVIDSSRFKGYLIAALGKNRRFDDEFVKNIQLKLFEFLKKQGEKVDDEGALEIKIKPVEFESWALEQAEFLKKSVHHGDEVAMAFFPTIKTAPDVQESAKEDMFALNIDDLEGDIQVPFNVYIYLPANNKYVLYTPKGGTFMANQKDRLKVRGITQMHMKKDDIAEAKKYQAQNYLNSKIEEYEQKALEKANKIKKEA